MEDKKISVVIPMYNSQDTIIDAIHSIISQTRYDLIDEIIIVNDGSSDNSEMVVQDFIDTTSNHKIKLISKQNEGAAISRNLGIKSALNDLIALLDADDIWMKEKIEIQYCILSKNPHIKALGSNRKDEIIHYGKKISNKIYKLTPFKYCLKNWPCTPSVIFDRKIFKDDCFFEESFRYAEEGLFFLYIASTSGLYYVTDSLVFCGRGKNFFGESGLSGNLEMMHKGVNQMMITAEKRKYILSLQLPFLLFCENLKYFRRKMLTKFK